jgi:hypothetical protein
MYYGQFIKKIKASDVIESVRCFDHLLEVKADGKITIDGESTQHKSLDEARKYIKSKIFSEKLEIQISNEIYEEISEHRIAQIIKEHHDVKVTYTLIESYIDLASSKLFSVDPVVQDIRSLNNLDRLVEGKLHYVLKDDSIVAISEHTQSRLNNLLQNQTEIIEYMRESKENFFHVLEQIEE